MIKQIDAIPGVRIKITKNPLTSTWAVDTNGNKCIEGFFHAGSIWPDYLAVPIYTGNTATIVSAPKRRYPNATLIGIKLDRHNGEGDKELFCFWVQIHRNAEKI